MTTSLVEALRGVASWIDDPKLRSRVGWMLEQMDDISTEVLTAGSAQRSLKGVRRLVGKGGAALVADRAIVGDPERTAVVLSLSTLRNLVLNLALTHIARRASIRDFSCDGVRRSQLCG